MRSRPSARIFLAVLLATSGVAPAQAGIFDVKWDERGGAALRTQVPAGGFTEWCGLLRAGESVNWEFEAAEPLDMNVHYHEGRTVHYPVQRDGVRLWNGTLQASVEDQYCWMWTNRGTTPVALQARLQKPLPR
jgi:hypothetical protein